MPGPTAFSRTEWELLGNAPLAAAAAVAVASIGGGKQEANAIVTSWRAATELFPADRLIQTIIAELDPAEREQREKADPTRSRIAPPVYATILDEALDLCHRAMDLLEAKASPQDYEDYQQFVLHLATQVARAVNESGIFNPGGDPISAAERSVLRKIATALRTR